MADSDVVEIGGLVVDGRLHRLVRDEIAPGTGIDTQKFFESLDGIVGDLASENARLLDVRTAFQTQNDNYFSRLRREERNFDAADYERFLDGIGYFAADRGDFEVSTENVDAELATICGPQLVCPMFIGEDPATNARYPLNAVNARWGSLYNALYGKPGNNNVIGRTGGETVCCRIQSFTRCCRYRLCECISGRRRPPSLAVPATTMWSVLKSRKAMVCGRFARILAVAAKPASKRLKTVSVSLARKPHRVQSS